MAIQQILFGSIVCCCVLFVVVASAQVIQEKSEPVHRVHETPGDSGVIEQVENIRFDSDPGEVIVTAAGVFENTGADKCADVTVISLPIGPAGSPITTTILGDNTAAAGPDCNALGPVPIWWEAFEIDQPTIVTIDLCNTSPVQVPSFFKLVPQCTTAFQCFTLIDPVDSGRGAPVCSDGNAWMTFKLPNSGTYYYPVFSDESQLVGGRGPYQIHIAAEEYINPHTGGPDVITGHIAGRDFGADLAQLDREGVIGSGIVALGLGTTACNQGGEIANWIELPNTNHPVMTGNLYKLHELNGSDRLEQIGYAWFKHGFGSSNQDLCDLECFCSNELGCSQSSIGPGCSDAYSSIQFDPCIDVNIMGPRSVIHPYTGAFPDGGDLGPGGGCDENYPSANHIGHDHPLTKGGFGTHDGISHRLQVYDVDLMPDLNVGSRYIAEGQYIVPDEYNTGSGTQNNNVSHREVDVTGPDIDGVFVFSSLADTVTESPAVDAWPGAQQSLIEPFPLSDGQARLAYKVTDLGGGVWHYEYAVYNMNMDVSVGSLSLPIPTSTTISNIEFFAPVHHAPETNADNYSNDPWVVTQGVGQLTWSTDSFVTDPLANAVRWGTLYNFRFDADSPPQSQLATIGLFKSGGSIEVPTLVPQAVGATDCNNNGIDDGCDLNCLLAGCNVTGCGESVDCDGTGVPDECEIDCNGNGIADSCDITGGTSADCTGNLIPDACEADCDSDGIADFCEIVIHGSSDVNSNGIPDECEIFAPLPVLPDPDSPGGLACGGGPNYGLACSTCNPGGQLCTDSADCGGDPCVPTDALCGEGFTCGSNAAAEVINNPWPKNRYIGFMPPLDDWAGREIAIRVTLVDLPSNPNCNGEVRWAGLPAEFSESQGSLFKLQAASLSTTPLFINWDTVGGGYCSDDDTNGCLVSADCVAGTCLKAIQLYGEEINPGSQYSIQAIDTASAGELEVGLNYSNGLLVTTAVWGDVIQAVGAIGGTGQPNIDDVTAVVGKWLGLLKPWRQIAQLQPVDFTPAEDLTIDDVTAAINAWLGSPYPFSVPTCP